MCFALAAAARGAPLEPTGPPALSPPQAFEIRLPLRRFTPAELEIDWPGLFAKIGLPRIHVIVQLRELPDEAARADLAEAGVVLGQPLSGRAFLATVRRDVRSAAPALRNVRWADALTVDDKIAPALLPAGFAPWARRVAGRVEVVAHLFPDGDIAAVTRQVRVLGGDILGEAAAAGVLAVSLPAGRVRDMAGLDDVHYLEAMPPPGTGESDRARANVHADVGAIPTGHADGNNVIVGVFDAAHVNGAHGDFGNRVAQGDTGTQGDAGTAANPHPRIHPTMTAGMIAGDGTNSVNAGAATANQWRGLAPAAQIRSYSFFSTGGNSVTDYLNDVTDAIQADGVQVLNNSWGDGGCTTFPYGSYTGRAPFLDGIVTGSLGRPVTVVFSAGNERDGFGGNNTLTCITNQTPPFANYWTLNHPKGAKNVIIVGAIDSANNAMTEYSSWGPTLDGRIKPDVVAPGHHNGTMSSGISRLTLPFGNPYGNPNQQDYRVPDDTAAGYAWFGQTSCSAAIVSGGVALMIDDWHRRFPGRADPLPSTLRALLVHNAQDLDDATTTWYRPGPDFASGYGLVRINETLQSLENDQALEGSVPNLGEAHYFLDVPAGTAQVRITLAWDDPPAVDNANPALINDLDLVVSDPVGTRHFPWTLDPANPTASALRTAEDHRNNLEQVLVDAPAAGTWSVTVRGTTVVQGRQSFSLVTGNNLSRQPVDLILALDVSDSMNDPASSTPGSLPKIEVLRRSAQLFLETWKMHAIASDRIGVAAFSSDVSTFPNSLPVLQPFLANFNAVSADVGSLTASGCTALGGALQVAFNSYSPASTNKRAILLLTDGMQSANPFVGETGSPSRLLIASFASGSTIPFGAFFCTTTAATGPGGGNIMPDGTPVADHDAEIYTIGVGTNGIGFHDLITRLAAENRGLSHFTTTPDSNLDLLYLNDLVRALKSNTLELIEADAGTLATGASKDLTFPVNGTSRSITTVVSWNGANAIGAIDVQVRGPGGAVLNPSHHRQVGFFTILKFDLPGVPGGTPGTWRLTLRRPRGTAVTYQAAIITDDSCLHYDLGVSSRTWHAGDPLEFTAHVTTAAALAPQALAIEARISAPAVPLGNLLAKWVPRTKAAREYVASSKTGNVTARSAAVVLEQALAELGRNPEFQKAAQQRVPVAVALKRTPVKGNPSGAAVFTASLGSAISAGTYEIVWEIRGLTNCGPVQRVELDSVFLHPRLERPLKPVSLLLGQRQTFTLTFTPADQHGNLLGPGLGDAIGIAARGFKPAGNPVDHLDGSYSLTFAGTPKGLEEAQISIRGQTWPVPVRR